MSSEATVLCGFIVIGSWFIDMYIRDNHPQLQQRLKRPAAIYMSIVIILVAIVGGYGSYLQFSSGEYKTYLWINLLLPVLYIAVVFVVLRAAIQVLRDTECNDDDLDIGQEKKLTKNAHAYFENGAAACVTGTVLLIQLLEANIPGFDFL